MCKKSCSSIFFLLIILAVPGSSQGPAPLIPDENGDSTFFTIDKSGVIQFKSSSKIEATIDKPEVILFIPKERPQVVPISFHKSFYSEMSADILKKILLK